MDRDAKELPTQKREIQEQQTNSFKKINRHRHYNINVAVTLGTYRREDYHINFVNFEPE